MVIPQNTLDQATVEAERAAKFNAEVDAKEQKFLSEIENGKWDHIWFDGYGRGERGPTEYISFGGSQQTPDPVNVRVAQDFKNAGYVVYERWYHNGYYGYTKHYGFIIARCPFTAREMNYLGLNTDWSIGMEQFRADRM